MTENDREPARREEGPRLKGLDVEHHLRNPAIRQRFVTPMFELVAPRYDDFTRRFSFGMDAGWKRQLVAHAAAAAPPGARCLDVACGTGDLAYALARARPDTAVSGIDVSGRMLQMARVLRPGGTLLTLDFYRPGSPIWRFAFLKYLAAAGAVYGWWWHREPVAYGYIARSIEYFVTWREFSEGLRAHGFRITTVRCWLGGGIALHTASRE